MSQDLTNNPPPEKHPESSFLDGLAQDVIITPVTLRRIFLLLTRAHFSDASHYGLQKQFLKDIIWSKDPKLGTLFVDLDHKYDAANLDRVPAVYVGLDDIGFKKVATDSFKDVSSDRSALEFITVGATDVIIRHLAKSPDETLMLGELSLQFFMGLHRLLPDRLKLLDYHVAQLKASKPFESPRPSANKQFVVDLIINIKFNAVWQVIHESHRIKQITFARYTELTLDD